MKIKMSKNYRSIFTLEDIDATKVVAECQKEDITKAVEWLEYAAREALKNTDEYLWEVVTVSAEFAKNCRIWNSYGDGSGDMDIWISGIVRTSEGFMECGAYLTDIWQTGATPYKHHMFIVRYKRADD